MGVNVHDVNFRPPLPKDFPKDSRAIFSIIISETFKVYPKEYFRRSVFKQDTGILFIEDLDRNVVFEFSM